MLILLANFAYLLTLCAFVARDILHLRSLLVVAQAIVIFYSWHNGVPLIASWNAVFLLINGFMVVQILRERRAVVLPDDLKPLYERHFSALSPPEFLRWWRQGERQTLSNLQLARTGERPEWLYFLLSGTVRVSRHHSPVLELPAGYFIAEMSLITGEPANADVVATDPIEVVRWTRDELHDLRLKKPALWTKIQSVIGHDLVEKIRLGEARTHS
jgi:CRP-like cAMP-binding protein